MHAETQTARLLGIGCPQLEDIPDGGTTDSEQRLFQSCEAQHVSRGPCYKDLMLAKVDINNLHNVIKKAVFMMPCLN